MRPLGGISPRATLKHRNVTRQNIILDMEIKLAFQEGDFRWIVISIVIQVIGTYYDFQGMFLQ